MIKETNNLSDIFNPNNLDLVIHFPCGKQLVNKINILLESIISTEVNFASTINAALYITSLLNDYYDLFFKLFPFKLDSETLTMIKNYNSSLISVQKINTVTKLKKNTISFFKIYPHLKNLNSLNRLTHVFVENQRINITSRTKYIKQNEINKSRARLKEDNKRLKHYKEAVELNKQGESVYKSSRIVAQKYDYDPQSFYSALRGWAKTNKIPLIKHR